VFESAFLSQRIAVMAARPGRVIEEIALEAPYPRTPAYRTSAQNNEYCRRASAALEKAIAHGG
jgi:NitT/TauT family transport system ATP-binding protein